MPTEQETAGAATSGKTGKPAALLARRTAIISQSHRRRNLLVTAAAMHPVSVFV